MERYSFKIRGVAFVATCRPEELDGSDNLGECEFRFLGTLAERLARVVTHEANAFRSFSGPLGDKQESRTGEPWRRFEDPADPEGTPDVPPLCLDADGGRMALATLVEWGNEGGEPWAFEWDGSGSPFWLFHDTAHADNDFGAWEDDGAWHVEATNFPAVGAWSEDRANLEGARRAVVSGVDAQAVLGELAGLAEAFRGRFGEESTALADFIDGGVPGLEEERAAYLAHVETLAEVVASEAEDADAIDAHEIVDGSSSTWTERRPGIVLALCANGWEEDYGSDLSSRAFYALRSDVEARARELFETRTETELAS